MPFCLSSSDLLVDLASTLADEQEDFARNVALQAPDGFELGVALGDAPCDISLRSGVGPKPADGDDVQGAVGRPVAAAVEAVAACLAGRSWDRAGAAEGGEAGF